jgi:uncharacterized protein (TIGR03435 family)
MEIRTRSGGGDATAFYHGGRFPFLISAHREIAMNAPFSCGMAIALFCAIVVPTRISAYQETPHGRPSFEVATVKPSSSTGYIPGGPVSTADYWAWRATTLKRLVGIAYLVREAQIDWQIKGGTPGWVDLQLWDVEGRINPPDVDATMPLDNMARAQKRMLRLQSLLEDRFKLRVEWQTRQAPVYNLVVARGGPKIKLDEDQSPISNSGSASPPSSLGTWKLPRGGMTAGLQSMEGRGVPIERLVSSLSSRAGRPIIDVTNLKGLYTFKIQWSEENSGQNDLPLVRRSLSLSPAFFTALQEQLGLRLESAIGSVKFLVIKSVQKPDVTQ